MKLDFCGVLGVERQFPRTDFEGRLRLFGIDSRQVRVTVEAVFAGVVARLNFDEADHQLCFAVGGESQRTGHMDGADDLLAFAVVDDGVSSTDLNPGIRAWDLAAFPRFA